MTTPLAHVLWIGGGTGAGKTTLATRLAGRHGLRTYHYDHAERAQIARMSADHQPLFTHWLARSMDERWVRPLPAELARTTLRLQEERFALVLEDLRALADGALVIAEGFGLRPDLIAPHVDDPRRAVFLIPTPAFREQALRAAGRLWSMPCDTSNPPVALANRLARDRLLTEQTREAARTRGFTIVDVDGTRGPDALAEAIARQWATWLGGH